MSDRTLRALVVEDEHLLALNLAESLRRIGLSIAGVANDRTQALAFLAAPESIDIAFIDLYLGREYHGLDLARMADANSVAVVLVTGHLSDAISDTLATLKSAALLTKPFSVDQLQAVVAAVRRQLPGTT